MAEKDSGKPKQPRKPNSWDLESPFDTIISLEELINMPPFKEASDSKGGSITAAVRIPSWLERKAVYLTESKGTPYHIKSDVYRDAIYVGLRLLNMRYKSNPDWAVEAKMANVIDRANLITRLKSRVDQISRPVVELWDSGDTEQAIMLLEDFVGAVVEVSDEWEKGKTIQLLKNDRRLNNILRECPLEVRSAVFGEKVKGSRDDKTS